MPKQCIQRSFYSCVPPSHHPGTRLRGQAKERRYQIESISLLYIHSKIDDIFERGKLIEHIEIILALTS